MWVWFANRAIKGLVLIASLFRRVLVALAFAEKA